MDEKSFRKVEIIDVMGVSQFCYFIFQLGGNPFIFYFDIELPIL